MYYIYDICPKCRDRFYERESKVLSAKEIDAEKEFSAKEIDAEKDSKRCPNCKNKLALACMGEQKIDDTIYRITIDVSYGYSGDLGLRGIMEAGNYDRDTALKLLQSENEITFEGDALQTFLNMDILTGHAFCYTVTPEFPFKRFLNYDVCLCPTCGSEMVPRREQAIGKDMEDYVYDGMFCETCNEWGLFTSIRKLEFDETVYQLTFSMHGVTENVKDELIDEIDYRCSEKDIQLETVQDGQISKQDALPKDAPLQDKIIVRGKPKALDHMLGILAGIDADYEIEPPYPHKVYPYKNEWDEEEMEELLKDVGRHNGWEVID